MSIQRLEAPRFQNLATALGLSKGSTIDGLEGLYVENVKDQTTGQSQDGNPWTCQALEVSQDGTRAWMSVFDFPDLSHLRGHTINIESTIGSNKKVYGVTIDVYKNAGKLKLSNSAIIDDHADQNPPEKQAHNLEAHGVGGVYNRPEANPARQQAQRPSQGRQSAPERQQTPPARQQQAPQQRQQAQTTVKKPIHGATVGMSLNQANIILLKTHEGEQGYFGSPAYSTDLFELASDIVRVSQYMESGHLAPTTKQRAKAQAEPEPPQEAPRQAARSQPMNEREEAQATATARGEHVAADDFGPGPLTDGMEDDDIPF